MNENTYIDLDFKQLISKFEDDPKNEFKITFFNKQYKRHTSFKPIIYNLPQKLDKIIITKSGDIKYKLI